MPRSKQRAPASRAAALQWWPAKCARWRSAVAAREIKTLVNHGVEQVEAATGVVRKAGQTIDEIVTASQRVERLLGEVATGAREQCLGVGRIGQAVQELDRMTQQNAAMVEQTAAAAMKDRAHALDEEVTRFRMPAGASLAPVGSTEVSTILTKAKRGT